VKWGAYALCGVTAALAGVCNACATQYGDPEAGATFELDAIAAVVIGGTSLRGGRGGVLLTLLGTLIMGYLNKILSLLGWQEAQRLLAKGLIIVLAVVIQETRRRK
jgi:ribose/xylose/arabinose/galactoside ABC-type transport system permease subunit